MRRGVKIVNPRQCWGVGAEIKQRTGMNLSEPRKGFSVMILTIRGVEEGKSLCGGLNQVMVGKDGVKGRLMLSCRASSKPRPWQLQSQVACDEEHYASILGVLKSWYHRQSYSSCYTRGYVRRGYVRFVDRFEVLIGPLMLSKGQLEVEACRDRTARSTSEKTVLRYGICCRARAGHEAGPIEMRLMTDETRCFRVGLGRRASKCWLAYAEPVGDHSGGGTILGGFCFAGRKHATVKGCSACARNVPKLAQHPGTRPPRAFTALKEACASKFTLRVTTKVMGPKPAIPLCIEPWKPEKNVKASIDFY